MVDRRDTRNSASEFGTKRELSSRRDELFDTINYAILSPHMLMSELFSHKKGSFTDAIKDRTGAANEVDSRMLFMDEIRTIPTEYQKLTLQRNVICNSKMIRDCHVKMSYPSGGTRFE